MGMFEVCLLGEKYSVLLVFNNVNRTLLSKEKGVRLGQSTESGLLLYGKKYTSERLGKSGKAPNSRALESPQKV